jgi:hypothetical protein
MLDFVLVAVSLAAQPLAFFGCLALGVVARSVGQAVFYAAGWAVAMQLFATFTGVGFADPSGLIVQFALRLAGAVIVALAVHLIYRIMRGSRPGGGLRGDDAPPKRPTHLRRVK